MEECDEWACIEDDLIARRGELAWQDVVPHQDRVVELRVAAIARPGSNTLILTLTPRTPADALCQFMPGQYLQLLPPEGDWLERAYSIGNAPRDDGSVEIQVRRVADGRFSAWLFERLSEGDVVRGRGPLGEFTLRSAPGTPLVFVAGGTGLAPLKAMIEQQLALDPTRAMRLFWGVGSRDDLYELDILAGWQERDPHLRCTVAVEHGPLPEGLTSGVHSVTGRLAEAIAVDAPVLAGSDAYIAGPPVMMPSVVAALAQSGVDRERIRVDSFGL